MKRRQTSARKRTDLCNDLRNFLFLHCETLVGFKIIESHAMINKVKSRTKCVKLDGRDIRVKGELAVMWRDPETNNVGVGTIDAMYIIHSSLPDISKKAVVIKVHTSMKNLYHAYMHLFIFAYILYDFVSQILPRTIEHMGRGLIQVTKPSLEPIYCDVHNLTHTIKLEDRIGADGDTCIKIHKITSSY
jgi:hypothetical protein